MRILVINDDKAVAELVRQMLVDEGYTVEAAYDGAQSISGVSEDSYDAIILESRQGGTGAISVLHELSNSGVSTPVIVSSDNSAPAEVVRLLDAGADDFIQRPVPKEVLAARVRAVTRRAQLHRLNKITVADLIIDRLRHEVRCNDEVVSLTARQYSLLEYLAMRSGEPVNRTELLEQVWKINYDPGSNVVDVHVAQLRKRLREAGSKADVRTVRGTGYKLSA